MIEKYTSAIKKITLNRATFSGEPIENLSFINFFYGNNGTGKTSIARAIREEDDGIEWEIGKTSDDYDVLVYDQDFIKDNFSEYSNLAGVFTVNKVNIEIQKQVEDKTAQRQEKEEGLSEIIRQVEEKKKGLEKLETDFQEKCWKKTAELREDFAESLTGKKKKVTFAEAVLDEESPAEHDIAALKKIYDIAYDNTATTYPMFFSIFNFVSIEMRGRKLLGKKIQSSAETDFSMFLTALNATDWVRQGHEHYTADAKGRCPYCQQKLPDSFEQDLLACFDEQYQTDIYDLEAFQMKYEEESTSLMQDLKSNIRNAMPSLEEIDSYRDKIALLDSMLTTNRQRIAQKVKEPASVVELEDTDAIEEEIMALIERCNEKINANNNAVSERSINKTKCKTDIMEHIAFILADAVKDYRAEKKKVKEEIASLEATAKTLKEDISRIKLAISQLNEQIVNTQAAIDGINNILGNSGFQGFRLKESELSPSTYEVVREDDSIAKDLSEGERNFIAFLYFYHLIKGSLSREEVKEKIVVIDDPVSSMDSGVLFIVATIVRELIEECRKYTLTAGERAPGNRIRQLFILTHNVYFHREITNKQAKNYRDTTFYLIQKSGNVSSVMPCVKERKDVAGGEMMNYNPVFSSYYALWDELRSVSTSMSALNLMRRILDHYFLQLCGYDGMKLRDVILNDEKTKLKDEAEHKLALSLLQYIDNPQGINDGLYFVDEYQDVDLYQRTFKKIFEAMNQEQHYEMMTETRILES